jgi:sugar lactone lactonase YvrE
MTGFRSSRAGAAILAVLVAAACAQTDDRADAGADTAAAGAAAAAGPITIADVGLATPESVLHDERADVYLVSNINGQPAAHDNNGFITRLRPDGTVEQLKWIEGGVNGVALHAPKGMALIGDTLYVADIDSVRAFDRTSGAPLGARGVPGASFLNDLAAGPGGMLYVTDTGVDASFAPTGTDAIYRFAGAAPTAVARGAALMQPNGITFDGERLILVSFASANVSRVAAAAGTDTTAAAVTTIATLPGGQLDGVVAIGSGALLVSSWEAQAVFRVGSDGQATAILENVEAPADIGWDAQRHRVLVPLFMANRIEIRDVH